MPPSTLRFPIAGNIEVTKAIEKIRELEIELNAVRESKGIILDRLDDAIAAQSTRSAHAIPGNIPTECTPSEFARLRRYYEDLWADYQALQGINSSLRSTPARPTQGDEKLP